MDTKGKNIKNDNKMKSFDWKLKGRSWIVHVENLQSLKFCGVLHYWKLVMKDGTSFTNPKVLFTMCVCSKHEDAKTSGDANRKKLAKVVVVRVNWGRRTHHSSSFREAIKNFSWLPIWLIIFAKHQKRTFTVKSYQFEIWKPLSG